MKDYFDNLIDFAKRNQSKKTMQHRKSYELEGIQQENAPKKRTVCKKKPETLVTDTLTKYLLEAGYLVVKVNSSNLWSEASKMPLRSYIIRNTGSSAGFPDLLAMKNGRALLIEVKAEGGKQSASQKEFEKLADRFGMTYIVARGISDIANHIDYLEV